jgi:putative ABC transport system substrate-binding protein
MKRRKFISLLAGTAVSWPLAASAQQTALPVIGFLNGASPDGNAPMLVAFRQGLKEAGYVEGQNVAIEYRWANGQYDQLPALAADLVRRQVSVIAATSTPANLTAKTATSTIPIVFTTGSDPVELGLVASLNRPGGNVTGVTQLTGEVAPKRVELAHELVPMATVIGLLVNPKNPYAEALTNASRAAAATLGLQLDVLHASTAAEVDEVFSTFRPKQAGALVIGTDAFFNSSAEQLAALSLRHLVPAIYEFSPVRRGRRPDELRRQYYGIVSSGRRLHRAYSQGRQTSRTAGATVYQGRADHQPQDRQDAWPYHTACTAGARRRGDRIVA